MQMGRVLLIYSRYDICNLLSQHYESLAGGIQPICDFRPDLYTFNARHIKQRGSHRSYH